MTDSIWSKLAAPLDPLTIKTREEKRGGKTLVLRYIDSRTVADILDKHALGEWTLKVTPLPPRDNIDRDGAVKGIIYTMQASLTVNGITREDVGEGDDYKAASSDAFKRAAVRFGIGRELYNPAPGVASVAVTGEARSQSQPVPVARATPPVAVTAAVLLPDAPACPKCGGKTWDNREGKKNPKAPDFKCRDKSCDGVIWPPKPGKAPNVGTPATVKDESAEAFVARFAEDSDEMPF